MIKTKVKKPKLKGIAKVPMIMQMEMVECGAASLSMVLAYYGKWIPLEKLREDCDISRDGSTAVNILKAARNYGLQAKAYRFEPDELRDEGEFPCIIHWNLNHFVVLKGFRGGRAYLNDPALGECSVSAEEFDRSFTGVCMLFEPSENFTPTGSKNSVLKFAFKRLKGTTAALTAAILLSVIAALIGVINPQLNEMFVDSLSGSFDASSLGKILAVFIAVGIISITAEWIKAVYLLKIDGKMAILGSTSFMWKLLHLPIGFFSQRLAGDIQQRQSDNGEVSRILIETVAPILMNTAAMMFYLIVMLIYSPLLALVGLVSVLINVIISITVTKKRIAYSRVLMKDEGALFSMTASGIDMINTIKSCGAETAWFEKWSGTLANVTGGRISIHNLNIYGGTLPKLIMQLSNAVIIIIGALLVIKGDFTIGMLTAFQGFFASFLSPVNSLIESGQTLQELQRKTERIDDVMEYEDDPLTQGDDINENTELPEHEKLNGDIEVKNLTFGYSRLKPPIVNNVSFKVEAGKSVALVGASGCGKSTIGKLISGLHAPWSGEILFDGVSRTEIPRSRLAASLAVIDQNVIMFTGSLSSNIRMWDRSIESFDMILAARDAAVHDMIMRRPGGYNAEISPGGSNFSGGQKQGVEIARALAADPTIAILDEATSALDTKTEDKVMKSIADRGITRIIIAHRLSTIRDCDEIIVLKNGEIAERGTHDELIAKNGLYNELVSNE